MNRTEADLAVMARIGGREYTRRYASVETTQPGIFYDPVRMDHIDRSVAADTSRLFHRQSWRRHSYWAHSPSPQHPARYWGSEVVMSDAPDPSRVALPESAFDWPIYRAGIACPRSHSIERDTDTIREV